MTIFMIYRTQLEETTKKELTSADLNFIMDLELTHEGHDIIIKETETAVSLFCNTCDDEIHHPSMLQNK